MATDIDSPKTVIPPSLQFVVMAAGQGKRMHSAVPKVLHPLAGRQRELEGGAAGGADRGARETDLHPRLDAAGQTTEALTCAA